MPLRQLQLGLIRVSWTAAYEYPIAKNHLPMNGDKPLITQCVVIYSYGDLKWPVDAKFHFDGASNPFIVQFLGFLLGMFQKESWHLLADLPHDFACEHPEKMPRTIADAMFFELLLALAQLRQEHIRKKLRHARTWRAKAWLRVRRVQCGVEAWSMWIAVVCYTSWDKMRGRGSSKARLEAARRAKHGGEGKETV